MYESHFRCGKFELIKFLAMKRVYYDKDTKIH